MKKLYIKFSFLIVAILQISGFNKVIAQNIDCDCTKFHAQASFKSNFNGICCYEISVHQEFTVGTNCQPYYIRLNPFTFTTPPTAINFWTIIASPPPPPYTFYKYPFNSSTLINPWETIANICSPAGQKIPDMLIEWISKDSKIYCNDTLKFPPCPTKDTCKTGCLKPLDPWFCDKGATTIQAFYCSGGNPINTSNIQWFWASAPCPALPTDPTGINHPGWTLFQSSGNTATTSLLTTSKCYIAFVQEVNPTCNYWTTPTTVNIYQNPTITTIQDRQICDPNPSTIGGAPSQVFSVPLGLGQSSQWLQSPNCNSSYTPVPLSQVVNSPVKSTFTVPSGLDGNCPFTSYCYRVVITSQHCGSVQKDFKIDVYHMPEVGTLTALPSTVCNGKATTIMRIPGCGKITKWEKSAYSSNSGSFTGWTDITIQYGTADNFSTNNLHNTTNCPLYIEYRVSVINGACTVPDIKTTVVQVLPELQPLISTSPSGVVCLETTGVNLTCNLNTCPPSLYPIPPVTYSWFHDNPSLSIGSGQVLNASQPGTYWVVVTNLCNSWISKPKTFCSKPVISLFSGCICKRPPAKAPYKLVVLISGGCTNCTYNIKWKEKKNGSSWMYNGTVNGLTSGTNIITIPSNSLPLITYGDQLHFQVEVISSSCGLSCIPSKSNINTVSVCPLSTSEK